jgi:hypothetical protein
MSVRSSFSTTNEGPFKSSIDRPHLSETEAAVAKTIRAPFQYGMVVIGSSPDSVETPEGIPAISSLPLKSRAL